MAAPSPTPPATGGGTSNAQTNTPKKAAGPPGSVAMSVGPSTLGVNGPMTQQECEALAARLSDPTLGGWCSLMCSKATGHIQHPVLSFFIDIGRKTALGELKLKRSWLLSAGVKLISCDCTPSRRASRHG
jgi:hypothetical protein